MGKEGHPGEHTFLRRVKDSADGAKAAVVAGVAMALGGGVAEASQSRNKGDHTDFNSAKLTAEAPQEAQRGPRDGEKRVRGLAELLMSKDSNLSLKDAEVQARRALGIEKSAPTSTDQKAASDKPKPTEVGFNE